MTLYTVISLAEIIPGSPAVEVHRLQALPDESAYDMVDRLEIKRVTHIFQGHPPLSDEIRPSQGVWALSWDVRNGNEPTGTRLFYNREAALDVAIDWMLASEYITQDLMQVTREELLEADEVVFKGGDAVYRLDYLDIE